MRKWTHVEPDILDAVLLLAKGSYQRNLLLGHENLSGSSLRGRAKTFGGKYLTSRINLLSRLRSAGYRIAERIEDHGARILIIEANNEHL